MEELWSFGSVIALWIGASCALWWLHRRRVYGHQRRQLEQATRAIVLIRDGQTVFDRIRTPVPTENPPEDTGEWLRAETHGLLRRIQDQGEFFDRVNTLRVQLQASAGIEDHTPLSEILNLRRDLWAASEILLVEDPKSFGATFAEDGAYERFHAEALQLLFKGARRTGDDLIDLRLSLAANDAESFAADLGEMIEAAREKDRLPTFSEAIAYPLAFFRAIPRQIATAYDFGRAFLGHAADTARAMRESETMARGASRLRQAQEDWPQRLSAGFERASTAARGSATALQRHYDFLVTAYDFQTKYEQVVRRAPEITERGRQFIARLELAERSERLRLTSANAAIWMTRRSLDGLAHLIAGLQRTQAALSETALWRLADRLLAPAPLTGRRTSPFRSYRRALTIAGLSEAAQQIEMPSAPKIQAVQNRAASVRKAGKGVAARRTAAKPKAAPRKVAAAEVRHAARQSGRSAAKSAPGSPPIKKAETGARAPASKEPARPIFGGLLAGLTRVRTEKPAATRRAAEAEVTERKMAAKAVASSPTQAPAPRSQTPPKAAADAKPTPAAPAVTTSTPSRRLFWRRKPGDEATPDASNIAVAPEAKPTPAASLPETAATTRSRGLFSWQQPKAEKAPATVTAAAAPKVEPPKPATPIEKSSKPDRAARKKLKGAKSKSADVAPKPEPGTEKPQPTASETASPAKLDGPVPPAFSQREDIASKSAHETPADRTVGAGTAAQTAPPESPPASAKVQDTAPSNTPQVETPPPQKPGPIHTVPRQSPDRTSPATTPFAFDADEIAAEAEPEKRPSFFKRLFMRKPKLADTGIDAQIIERLAAAYAEQSEAAPGTGSDESAPIAVAPRLMEKLSSLGGDDIAPDAAEEESVEDDPEDMDHVASAEDAEQESELDDEETDELELTEPGPLTLSILELQSKMKPRAPHIRSFPWLRE